MQDKFSLKNRTFSYWEKDEIQRERDFIIIGAGLVGLSTAISVKEKYPGSSILILERASIPYGASTRNAGFACFGSVSEIINDLEDLSISDVELLIHKRWQGLQLLKDRIGDDNLQYKALGGYEVFSDDDQEGYETSVERLTEINYLISRAVGQRDCFKLIDDPFKMRTDRSLIYNQYEGQLHPGMMMRQLQSLVLSKGIEIQCGNSMTSYEAHDSGLSVFTENKCIVYNTNKLLITTNAFTPALITDIDIVPARNQVMITKPIKDLKIKGCFHFDKGYVYFRNVSNRLLIGGGRNTARDAETTDAFGLTESIKDYLRGLLSDLILVDTKYEEDMWWSGIIATGADKNPIVKEISKNVFLGVRLGGMGVALGSLIGQELAELV